MSEQNERTDADRQEMERCMRDPLYYYEKYWQLGQQTCPLPPAKPEPIDSGPLEETAFPIIRRRFAALFIPIKEKPRLS